ncbi:MAG TPA: hypothetical protein VLX92_17900 [Kofleriaceae bacterium]|nr:hypothetical protein [Kofleriaceae bacterium]
MRALIALALVSACATDPRAQAADPDDWAVPHAPWYEPQPEPPIPARLKDPAAARYHMRRHFDDLRMIEQLLVAGRLDEGLALSYLLARKTEDAGLAPWDDHADRVITSASELMKAPGLDEALRREARVGVECAKCHVAAQSLPVFGAVPPLPPDRQTAQSRMARHVWAVDRLWEGLIGADDSRWSRGLAVLADNPIPLPPRSDAPAIAAQLQQRARAQLAARPTTSLDDRGAAYGEMLVQCAACHASLHVNVP